MKLTAVLMLILSFLIFAVPAAALTGEQIDTINDLAISTGVDNDTLISIFETGSLDNYYTKGEMDIYLNLTREIISIQLQDITNMSSIVKMETNAYLENYTRFIEEKTKWLEIQAEMTEAITALKEEVSIEGSSEEIYSLIEEMQISLGAMPNQFVRKIDLDSALSNISKPAKSYTPAPAQDNTVVYAFLVIVIFGGVMYYLSKRGEVNQSQFMAAFGKLKKGDEVKSMRELENERLKEELNDKKKRGKK